MCDVTGVRADSVARRGVYGHFSSGRVLVLDSALALFSCPGGSVSFSPQLIKDVHHSPFARANEPARGDFLRIDQKLLGFGQVVAHRDASPGRTSTHRMRHARLHLRESRALFGRTV